MLLTRLRLLADSLDTHPFHKCADLGAADSFALPDKLITKHACAHKRVFQVEAVESAHERKVILTDWSILVIDTTTAYSKQPCLLAEW